MAMETPLHSGTSPEPGGGLEDVERLLARQRFRTPPAAWRELILTAAVAGEAGAERLASREADRGVETRQGWWALFRSGWTWVGAAWGLAWMLCLGAVPERSTGRVPVPPLSAAAQAELAAQRAALGDVAPWTGGWVAARSEARHPARPAEASPATPSTPGRPRASLRRTFIERLV